MVCNYATRYLFWGYGTLESWCRKCGWTVNNVVFKNREPYQGENFMSHMQLLGEVYNLLHIHPIQTAPCYLQTDGLVKCFSKTLKAMSKKLYVVSKKGQDQDEHYLMCYLHTEVPQWLIHYRFSPFELLAIWLDT